jgi:hypothetical protein
MEEKNYEGMNIFQEAKQREIDGFGYNARRFKILWQSKKCSWNFLAVDYGIRWSDKWQIFPVWNISDNSKRSLMFGFGKLHCYISYARAGRFKAENFIFMRKSLWRVYQLLC